MPDLPAADEQFQGFPPDHDAPQAAPTVVEKVSETKPGYATTELWLSILVVVLTNLNALPVPDKYQWIVTMVVAVGYAISRGLAKQGVPVVEPTTVEEA